LAVAVALVLVLALRLVRSLPHHRRRTQQQTQECFLVPATKLISVVMVGSL
jgi:hypothetical protein